jgi:ATP-dependent Clp protease adaptor protein ClpS
VGTTTAPVRTPKADETGEETTAPLWQVILHDDDVTTQEFVVWLLTTLFAKPDTEARRLMLLVHRTGAASVTVCPRERAELYVEQVRSLARPRGFPLTATTEPA